MSKSACRLDVGEIAEVVVEADVIQHAAERRRATPMPSGPLNPPNCPPPFRCGSRSRNTPGMPRRRSFRSTAGKTRLKSRRIASWALSPIVGRHEMLQRRPRSPDAAATGFGPFSSAGLR